MAMYILCLIYIGFVTRYPHGIYYAHVKTGLMMPNQHIQVNIRSKSLAKISLRGLVNFDDHFKYGYYNGKWKSEFSPDFTNMLLKWKCKLRDFEYDKVHNCARLNINLPIIGTKQIILHSTHNQQLSV
tara:strand:+ start:327 stop:710 length:384 start_codon:yes stop_codon:yes gene_type:complete